MVGENEVMTEMAKAEARETLEGLEKVEAVEPAKTLVQQLIEEIRADPAVLSRLTADRLQMIYDAHFKIDYRKLMDECVKIIMGAKKGEKTEIMLPLPILNNTKMNRARLATLDKKSPSGLVTKGDKFADMAHHPFASGRFDCMDVARWSATIVAKEEMADVPEAE